MAARLRTQRVVPLTFEECRQLFDRDARLQFGMLPPILFSDEPKFDLKHYCGEYLREEIQPESLVRNLPAFSPFLEMATFGNTELISYTTIARDCGVSAKTMAEYYQILKDTLLCYFIGPYTKTKKRRSIATKKFYFVDCGVSNSILGRVISPKTLEYAKIFEQFF